MSASMKLEDTYKSRFGDSFPIEYWYLEERRPGQGQGPVRRVRADLDFFEQMIGPYPSGPRSWASSRPRTWAWNTRP